MTTVQQRGQNHHSRAMVSRSIRISRAMATNVPSEHVTAVIVTELDMKLRPLFMLTWRVADVPSFSRTGAGHKR